MEGQAIYLGDKLYSPLFDGKFADLYQEFITPVTSSIPVKDGLVLGLTMESISYNGTGSTWYDISGNEFHHTIYGSPTWDATNGFTMNGSSQYMQTSLELGTEMGNFFTGNVGQMTLIFDGLRGTPVKRSSIHNIWANNGGGNIGRYFVDYTTSGGAGAVVGEYLGSASNFLIDSGQNVDEGAFRILTVYASGSVGSGWEVAGTTEQDLENPQTLSGTWATTGGYSTVGARDTFLDPTNYYLGNIRNVLLYNRFLSSGERTSIYNWLNSLT